MTNLDDRLAEDRQILDSAKRSPGRTFGAVIGSLLGNATVGASYAFGGLLVWELFFR